MFSRKWNIVLSAIFLTISFTFQNANAAGTFSIELRDGTVFENVKFQINAANSTIVITKNDTTTIVSFTDISRIIDEKGTNVTGLYVSGFRNIITKPIEPKKEELPQKVVAVWEDRVRDLWRFALSINSSFTIPTGNFYNGVGTGFGYSADVSIFLKNQLSLRGTVSHSGMKAIADEIAPGFIILQDNLNFDVWRYFLSAQYFERIDWSQNVKSGILAFGGIGFIAHKFTGELFIQDPVSNSLFVVYGQGQNLTKMAFTGGVSYIRLLSPTIGIELGTTVDLVLIGSRGNPGIENGFSIYENIDAAFVFDVRVGIITFL